MEKKEKQIKGTPDNQPKKKKTLIDGPKQIKPGQQILND